MTVKNKDVCWLQSGNTYQMGNLSTAVDVLPIGIYELKYNQKTGFYLNRTSDKFELPTKVYGLEEFLINRIIKTWISKKENLGVLLNGVKGSGKTITAKIIANNINLPVIMINEDYGEGVNPNSFLNTIQEDVVVLIDEYEKIYEKSSELLTVMDGVIQNGYRKLFLLTTNGLFINDNLLDRPGRIRYLKTFNTLTESTIISIIEDKLINKSHYNNCLALLKKINKLTVDVCLSIIDEINIHNVVDIDFCSFFNAAEIVKYVYDIEFISSEEIVYLPIVVEDESYLPIFARRSFHKGLINSNLYLGWQDEFSDWSDFRLKPIKIISPNELTAWKMIQDNDTEQWIQTKEIITLKINKTLPINEAFTFSSSLVSAYD